MKKLICVAGFAMVAGLLFAQVNERGNKNFTGEVNFDGDWKIKGTKVTATAAELNLSDGLTATAAQMNQLGTGTLTLDGTLIDGVSTSTTSRTSLMITPVAASSRSGVSRQSLVTIGDITGNTAFGFGVTNQSSYGLMACFGRTIAATANWDGNYDTALDARMINKLVNNDAYNMRGGYIKCKNYSGASLGKMVGLFVEAVADGTNTTSSSILELGSDASTVTYGIDMDQVATPSTADIRFSNGALVKNGDANTLTITEAAVNVVGTFSATSVGLAGMTNGFGMSAVYTGTVTNGPAGTTNVMVIKNGLIQSVTLNP